MKRKIKNNNFDSELDLSIITDIHEQNNVDMSSDNIETTNEIKTVYVVPNRVSKKKILKQLKNQPIPEIIDVSQLSSNVLVQSSLPKIGTSCEEGNRVIITPKIGKTIRSIISSEANIKKNDNMPMQHVDNNKNNNRDLTDGALSYHVTVKPEILISYNIEDKNQMESFSYSIAPDEILEPVAVNIEHQQNMSIGNKKKYYMEEHIDMAVNDVINNKISTRRAAHIHGIKHGVLLSKLGKHFNLASSKNVLGADPALTEQEESNVVDWIKSRFKKGCPVKKIDLINRVSDIVSDGRTTRFKDGVPGEKWFNNFLTRNPSVSTLGPAARVDSRQIPSKRSILSWFKRCSEHLEAFRQDHLLEDPRRIGNVEELTLCLVSSKTQLAGGSNQDILYLPEESSGNIMVLIGACADGMLMPPMPVFSCRKPPPALINSIPSGWGIGLSKDGFINKEVVHSFFKNILIPWLTEQNRLPFILFIDKLKLYLSVNIADFCAQKGLLIYNFYPNSYSVIQPMYKSVIDNVKKTWNSLSQHRNDREALLKFCPNLSKILYELAPAHVVVNGFRECGLYPFNPKAPDYDNCLLSINGSDNKTYKASDYAITLDVFECMIGKIKTEIFRETLQGVKLLRSEDKSLYKIWYKLVSKVDVTRSQGSDIQDYKHEQIIRGAYRKLPRPETYLMVVEDNNGQELEEESDQENYLNFSEDRENDEDSSNNDVFQRTMVEVGIMNADELKDSIQEDKQLSRENNENNTLEYLTTDDWKTKPVTEQKVCPSALNKVHEARKKDKIKKIKSSEGTGYLTETETLEMKKILFAVDRLCTQCNKATDKLIKCMVCDQYIHFECMMDEEQQIMSDLYKDNVAFDYICPTCSS